jgi:hypothetical protein
MNPRRAIRAHKLNRGATLGPKRVEEATEGRLGSAFAGPNQPPRIVVNDHNDVLVSLLVADLVDTDAPQTRQQIPATDPGHAVPRR